MSGVKNAIEETVGPGYGRLKWRRDGDDLIARSYRICLAMPGLWETTYLGRTLRVDAIRSMAIAGAERHHRERQRVQRMVRWGLSGGVALIGAIVAGHWLATLQGVVLFAVAVWAFLSSLARCVAAATRSLLDPFRTRESWEPRDWWNH